MSIKKEVDIVSGFFCSLFRTFESEASWMHDIFNEDDVDFLAIHPGKNYGSGDTHRKWINSVYGLSSTAGDNWKDFSHVGGMKLRSKYNSMVAHLMQDLVKDGRISGCLKHTAESDIEELQNKDMLGLGANVPPEQIEELVRESKKSLDKAQSMLLDNKQEAKAEDEYFKLIRDLAKHGICALETNIRTPKKIRNYAPKIVQSEEGDKLSLVPTPSFKEGFILKSKRISPRDIYLDPEANGDPQAGVGVFKTEEISFDELSSLRKKENYDTEAIESILKEYESDKTSSSGDVSSSPVAGSTSGTKPFDTKTFWGNVSRSNIESWKKESPLVRNLIKSLKANKDVDYSDAFATFNVHVVLVDDQVVYFSELMTSDAKRPVAYGRMLPLEGTNYAFGVFALGREPGRLISKLWSRSINNEIMVGSAMFAFDPQFIDESTLTFQPGGKVKLKKGASLLSKGGASSGLQQLDFHSVSAQLLNLIDRLDFLLDELTLIPKNMTGVSPRGSQTATEVTQNLSSAQTILLGIRRNFDKDIIQVDLEHAYHYLQIDADTPKEALSDAYIEVFGAETFALRVINKQMVQELLQILPSLADVSPEVISSINWPEMLVSILEGFGFDKSKFMNSPELKSKLMAAQEQLTQLTQQIEQSQEQIQEVSQEAEKLQDENEDLKLKNHELTSTAKVEAKLLLEKIETENLRNELARLKQDMAKCKSESSASEKNKTAVKK